MEAASRRVLVVANRTAGAPLLLEAVRKRADEGPCTFALLIPNEPRKGAADWTLETAIPLLSRAAGGPVEGIVGEADPFEAVKSALRQQPGFDEVILSTLPKRVSEWIRRDLPHRVVTLGVPVTNDQPARGGRKAPSHRCSATWLTRLTAGSRHGRASSIQPLGSARWGLSPRRNGREGCRAAARHVCCRAASEWLPSRDPTLPALRHGRGFSCAKIPARRIKMRTAVAQWPDERLNDLAAALEPVPAQVAELGATVKHLAHVATALEPVPAQLAVLAATVDRLADENRALRVELSARQRQLVQIAWGLVAALLGAAAALIAALV
jgi:hypothetical protein